MTGYDSFLFANQHSKCWLICPTPTVNRFHLKIRRVHTVPILVSTGYEKVSLFDQLKLEGYSERAMKNCFSCLGRPQSGRAMLTPFFQPRYSTVFNEKSDNLLPTFSRCTAINYYTLYSVRKMGLTRLLYYSTVSQERKFQLHCIEFNVPVTNISTKKLRGKNALLQNQTRSLLS